MNVEEHLRGDRDESALATLNADWLVLMSQVKALTDSADRQGFKMTFGGEYWVWNNWNQRYSAHG